MLVEDQINSSHALLDGFFNDNITGPILPSEMFYPAVDDDLKFASLQGGHLSENDEVGVIFLTYFFILFISFQPQFLSTEALIMHGRP